MTLKTKIGVSLLLVYLITIAIQFFISVDAIYKAYSKGRVEKFDTFVEKTSHLFESVKNNSEIISAEKAQEYQEMLFEVMRERGQKDIFMQDIIRGMLFNLFLATVIFGIFFFVVMYLSLSSAIKPLKALTNFMENYSFVSKPEFEIRGKPVREIRVLFRAFRRMMKKIDRYERQIKNQEKVSGWFQMSRAIVHEISNFLMPIEISVGRLEQQLPENKDVKSINHAFLRIKGIVSSLRSFYKSGTKRQIEKFDIVEELNFLVSGFNAKLINNSALSEISITTDKLEFSRMCVNLLKNGIESVEPPKEPDIKIVLSLSGDIIELRFCDNGKGVKYENIDTIFEPEFTTKKRGLGLGLSLVMKIVTFNNWEIELDTILGEGSTFIVKIPFQKEM